MPFDPFRILNVGSASGGTEQPVSETAGLDWRRPKGCDTNACVETAESGDNVYVRHSESPDGPVLRFTRVEWAAFVRGLNAD